MAPPPRFDILGFGAVAVDDLLFVDEYPAAEHKVRVRHRLRQCGGLTGTALVAAARLGARCAYVGLLGEDPLSEEVAACLGREGIDTAHCVRRPDARPAHSTIVVDQRRHTRTIFASLEGAIGPDPERPGADLIRSARVLLIDHHGPEGTLRAVRIGRDAGVRVVADFERDPGPPFEELLGLIDHLVLSERFARQLTGRDDPAGAAAALWRADRRAVVITCGAAGCWCLGPETGGRARHSPASPVEVVDTTGCGDVFHGAYAAALARGMGLPSRVVYASGAAALKATRRGGQAGIPDRQTLEAFLAEQERRDRECR
jgi:sulfofructose kinase